MSSTRTIPSSSSARGSGARGTSATRCATSRRSSGKRASSTPRSASACTGAAVGAALCGLRPIVTHPRVDFAVLAMDQMVNQAANGTRCSGAGIGAGGGPAHGQSGWGTRAHTARVCTRGSLTSPDSVWVAPATPQDAQDWLVSAMDGRPGRLHRTPLAARLDRRCPGADRLYRAVQGRGPRQGGDVTIVGLHGRLGSPRRRRPYQREGIDAEVIDPRVLNPLDAGPVIASVEKTNRLVVVEGDWGELRRCSRGHHESRRAGAAQPALGPEADQPGRRPSADEQAARGELLPDSG